MNDLSIEEFCEKHNACFVGRDWAMANCRDMAHAWETLKPEWLVWVATRQGVLDDRTLRLFAVWCARQVQHLMTDPRSLAALNVAERHANGQATHAELFAAQDAARDAAWAARDAAWPARDAAWAARYAAMADAWPAARYAAMAAAWPAVLHAALASAQDAARAAQAAWLRKNAKPNFK